MNPVVMAGIAVVLVAANGYFVAVEFAVLAARRSRVEEWAEEGRLGAASALAGMRSLNLQLASCQLGITAMSLMLGWLVEPVVSGAFEDWLGRSSLPAGLSHAIGFALGLGIVSFVHMVVGEMVPKSLALSAPERTLVALGPVNRVWVASVGPLVRVLNAAGLRGARLLGVEPTDELDQAHTAPELQVMLERSAAGGEVGPSERDLLAGALSFLGVRVADVMADRRELVTVPATATIAEAEELVHRSGHTRVLVTGRTPNDVVGFLHAKDLLSLGDHAPGELLPAGLVRVALRVAPSEPLPEVLPRMRRARRHVAVVVDDGGVRGLVTLEDILEAIVGEIHDESDQDAHDEVRDDDTGWRS